MISSIRKTIQNRRAAALAVLVLLCLLTAGCGGRSAKQTGEDQSGSAQEQTGGDQSGGAQQQTGEAETRGPVRIGVLQIADSFPLYVAVEEGLFQKHGLDVEIIEFQSASDQSVAYEAGELDGMMTDMIVQSLINKSSAEDGMKTVAMAFGGDASEGRFIVASAPDSGISAPGRCGCLRVVASCSVSSGKQLQMHISCRFSANALPRAVPQVPAPRMPILIPLHPFLPYGFGPFQRGIPDAVRSSKHNSPGSAADTSDAANLPGSRSGRQPPW